ncbi:hypothetical protein [Pedobacter heparinus]|uniref:hypothetical protein n=1 Tax=Pedobacter heparinus TaxID=984 RepID=UPI0029312A2B|nr:hypothetical protein [Pedobacter heparinus]
MKKYLLLCACIIGSSFYVKAQKSEDDLKNLVIKNILSYQFRYALDYKLFIEHKDLLQGERLFFNEFWSDSTKKLKIDMFKSELAYPVKGYTIYRFFKKGYRFKVDSNTESYSPSSADFDEDYLVAYNERTKSIKFISGNFFKSKIADDFKLDLNNPLTFSDYLKLKYYNTKCTQFKFISEKAGILYFYGTGGVNNQELSFIVDARDFNISKVQYKENKIIK